MAFTLSKHAADAIRERGIRIEWVEETLEMPIATEVDTNDATLLHALRPIEEFGHRALRVIYRQDRSPAIVVTAYFDRAMKGKL